MRKSFLTHRYVRLGAIAALALASACDDAPPANRPMPEVIRTILDGRDAPSSDRFDVWVCRVPTDTIDPVYAATPDRVALNADLVVEQVGEGVAAFWSAVSFGAYRPTFTAGGGFEVGATDSSQQCIDGALARVGPEADAVLVVADAQHASDQPGGRSTPGTWLTCDELCAVTDTGRYVYLGANDFHPALDAPTPLDLIEHELGHSLGLPHSGDVVGATGNRGVGPYDVMADSAAPRAVDPTRRDAPDLLAIDRLDLGWLPLNDVHIATHGSDRSVQPVQRVELASSSGPAGTRLIVVPIDNHRALTVEMLAASGFDSHLSSPGVVVHLIDDSPEHCAAATRCTDLERVQQIVAADDADRTLLVSGDSVTFDVWSIEVVGVEPSRAIVTVAG